MSAPPPLESITCPVCHRTSYHPDDIEAGYCGNCHDWTSPPAEYGWPAEPLSMETVYLPGDRP
jgi:hypothetical protein